MKADGILINTGRGALVDERALIRYLQIKPEFWAGLDVYLEEGSVPRELLELPNAVCLPHIASAESGVRIKMSEMVQEEAIRFAKGLSLKYECLK
jgi:glyoxylate reductase